jgi:hypothetical protein
MCTSKPGSSVSSEVTGYGLDDRGSNPDRSKVFLFSITSRPVLGLSQSPIKRVHRTLSLAVKPLKRELHLVPRLRMRGALPPFEHSYSWHGI